MEISEKDRQEIARLYREFVDAEDKLCNRLLDFYLSDKDVTEADLFLSEAIGHLYDVLKEREILKEGE